MATAFQPDAFQPNAFQIEGGTLSGLEPVTAFQPNAFQDNAFQIFGGLTTGSTYTLNAEYGSFTLTGQSATFTRNRLIDAVHGTFNFIGQDASFTYTPAGVYTLTAETGYFVLTGQPATFTYISSVVGHTGGDDAWKKEKGYKKKDLYKENVSKRRQAVIDAYEGLLEPQTEQTIAIEAKAVLQSTPLAELDIKKVQRLLQLWQDELDRRQEQDDEEALMLLL